MIRLQKKLKIVKNTRKIFSNSYKIFNNFYVIINLRFLLLVIYRELLDREILIQMLLVSFIVLKADDNF